MGFHSEVPLMESDTSGSGEPLVLVPGGLTGWISWIPHAERLAASRQVTRVQLHSVALGLSGAPLPADYSVNYEVTALGKTLDALSLEMADFAAWSYGGEITLSFAIHHPHRVRSLTLIEPPAVWLLRRRGPLPEAVLEQQAFFQTVSKDAVDEEQLVTFVRSADLVPADVDPRTLEPWPVWMEHRQSLRIRDAPHQHEDSIELLRAFEKPVLLVKGESANHNLHHDIIDVLVEELSNASVVTFPGGHAPHIVSMQPFMERFTEFLSEQNGVQ